MDLEVIFRTWVLAIVKAARCMHCAYVVGIAVLMSTGTAYVMTATVAWGAWMPVVSATGQEPFMTAVVRAYLRVTVIVKETNSTFVVCAEAMARLA